MTWPELIATVATERDLPEKHVQAVVEHALEVLKDAVWRQGRLEVKARVVITRHDGRSHEIPAHEAVVFRASSKWRCRP